MFHQVGETREHFFGGVPVIAYTNNEERQGDFEQITSLIDAYNQLMSSRLTDKKKFVDALLVFFGMTLREGDESRLATEKFLDGCAAGRRVEYIQKTFDETSVQVLADALVREMHKMTLTVDMSDEKFSGNASGQALKLKLLTMNLLVKNKIRRMERGLKERFALYNRWLVTMGEMKRVGVNDVDVVFTVNMPINEAETVELVTQLQGIVDDQTLLSQLWFVRDPAEAAENIRRQRRRTGRAVRNRRYPSMMKNSRKRKPEPEAEKPTLDALLQEDPAYQEAFDQKVNQLLRSARTRWEREQAHQPDEEEQLEGIRTREQESVQLSREREALEQEKQDFARQRMEVAVGQELQKRGLPAAFAPWLAGDTPEESAENIDTFELLFQEALAAAVTSRMRGTGAPREPNRPPGLQQEGAAQ